MMTRMPRRQPLRNQKEKKTLKLVGPVFGIQFRQSAIAVLETGANANNPPLQNGVTLCKENLLKDALGFLNPTDHLVDRCTQVSLLQGCNKLKTLTGGKLFHAQMHQKGFMGDRFLLNTLITMYAKCGCPEDSRRIFDQMPTRDAFSWNAMISAYAWHGFSQEALALFRQMQEQREIQPDQFTFTRVLPACNTLEALVEVHEAITSRGFQCDVFVATALLDMYAKCGSVEKAREVFDKLPERNIVSWNAMIAGYLQNGLVDEATKLFRETPHRNVVSWTAMIVGYVQNGLSLEAMEIFRQMLLAGVEPDAQTFAGVLPACASLGALQQGMEIHGAVIRSGLESDAFVGTTLVDMYAKCERVDIAHNVFDKMPQQNATSWTAMIAGYAQNGYSMEALEIFRQMQRAGVEPNSKTFASVLPACANLAALEQGMEIHEEIIRSGFRCNVFMGNALLDMCAKCGSIDKASEVFTKIQERDVVSWNSMIAGYAMHGCGNKALELFEEMQESGMKPNHVTFVGVLSACCHAGLVDEGRKYFHSMGSCYSITPVIEHYGCMVDLLGRAGHLEEVKDLISKMPMTPDATTWGCFLGACIIYNNTELGEYAAEHLFELNWKNGATYVVLSNFYAAVGRWDGIENLRKMMKDRGITPTAGCSWIEINKQVHAFRVTPTIT